MRRGSSDLGAVTIRAQLGPDRITEEVCPDSRCPEGFEAFLYDWVRQFDERFVAVARQNGYPDAEVVQLLSHPWCRDGGACPSDSPPGWQILLAGPLPDSPAGLLDPRGPSAWTDAESVAVNAFWDTAPAREMHTTFETVEFGLVGPDREDRERHLYTPQIQPVWFR